MGPQENKDQEILLECRGLTCIFCGKEMIITGGINAVNQLREPVMVDTYGCLSCGSFTTTLGFLTRIGKRWRPNWVTFWNEYTSKLV